MRVAWHKFGLPPSLIKTCVHSPDIVEVIYFIAFFQMIVGLYFNSSVSIYRQLL